MLDSPILAKETETQHPAGTSISVVAPTLLNSLTAAGVLTARDGAKASPFTLIATSIGLISAPADNATFK